MTFWSGDTLATRIPALKIIEPYDPNQIDCASFRLSIGHEVYLSPMATGEKGETSAKRQLSNGAEFEIAPGQFAYIITEELVRIPENVLAFISMRAGYKLRGLVNISGFHVDPGYNGRLVYSVLNAGPRTVTLAQGEPCFLIFLADLDLKSSTYVKKKPGFANISGEVLDYVRGEMQSLAALNEEVTNLDARVDEKVSKLDTRVDKAEIRFENNKTLFTILISALVVIVVQLGLIVGRLYFPERSAPQLILNIPRSESETTQQVPPPPPVHDPPVGQATTGRKPSRAAPPAPSSSRDQHPNR